jgi:hypothetical protein
VTTNFLSLFSPIFISRVSEPNILFSSYVPGPFKGSITAFFLPWWPNSLARIDGLVIESARSGL